MIISSPGPNPPEELYIIVEIPKGSNIKYELDLDTGLLKVDRILYTAMAYPYNYGIIPHTLMPDGDELDAVLLIRQAIYPGSIIIGRPIGMLEMEDEKGIDHKLIAVPIEKIDPSYKAIRTINDVSEFTLNQIRHFFMHYKDLEPGKWSRVRKFLDYEDTLKLIEEAIIRYRRRKSEN